jgi:diguanylate cyclase (GGDEF)-like protein/PAS domain S-box-containing protein
MLSLEKPPIVSELYRMVFDHALDAIFILDTSGTIIEANPVACQQVGRAKHKLLYTDIRQIHDPESAENFSHHLEQVKTKGYANFEAIHIFRDGTCINVDIQLRSFEHEERLFVLNTCRVSAEPWHRDIEYEKIIQAAGEGYWMVSVRDARIIDTNETFCQMVGYSRQELLSMTVSDLEAVESPEETAIHIRKIMDTGHDLFETKHRHKKGHIIDLEISVSYADIRGGVIFVFTRDISERKRQEELLQLSSLVVNTSTVTVMVTDAENRIISVNPAFTKITGYLPEEVIGRNPNLLSSGCQSKEFYQEMWKTLHETGHWEGEWWNRRRNDEEYAEQVNLNVLRNKDGSVFSYVKIATDITEKKRQDDQVWYQANYDTITGLPNRRLFFDRLNHEMKKCARTDESLAVFYIDLDNFKDINDKHGHDTGDILLIEASRRLGSCIRITDTVARLGGDEFAVLLIDLADTSRVDAVARHINHMLAQPFRLRNLEISISGSIGIAIYPDDGIDMSELIRKADHAMYTAKRSGKNRYTYRISEES